MNVIVVANQKGGVGKSTISCNLGVASALSGQKTLIIDADPQGSSATFRAVREKDDLKVISIIKPTIHKDIQDLTSFDRVIVDAGGRDSADATPRLQEMVLFPTPPFWLATTMTFMLRIPPSLFLFTLM